MTSAQGVILVITSATAPTAVMSWWSTAAWHSYVLTSELK